MAKTRLINTKFWTDSYIQGLDSDTKLLFLYLLTNTHTEICGIYEISINTIKFETGIDYDRLSNSMDRLSAAGKIFYTNDYILIKNFAKHQQSNPKILKGVQRTLEQLPSHIKEAFCVVKDQSDSLYIDYDSLYIDYDSLSHLNLNSNLNLNLNILSKDNTDESEPLENLIINNSLEVKKEKEKSSAKKEKEHEAQISTESDSDCQDGIIIEKEPKTSNRPNYGNEDINRMLGTIKGLLYLDDFKETQKLQRQYGLHLVNLKNKLGKEEFASRFMQLAQDEFHLKNMGSLKYIYTQIKGFVPIKKDKSIPEIGIDPTKT